MTITEFISSQPAEPKELLYCLHEVILKSDKTVTAVIAPMIGKDINIYNAPDSFKYGLVSVMKYMSLHGLPMYMNTDIYNKYKVLLPSASFQKGCINFNNKEEMPLKLIKDLIKECFTIDLSAIREQQLKAKSKKK